MKRIRLNYCSKNVRPALYVSLFFQLTGFHVYGHFLEYDSNAKYEEFDVDIYLLFDEADWNIFMQKHNANQEAAKRIVVIPDGMNGGTIHQVAQGKSRTCVWRQSQDLKTDASLLSDIVMEMWHLEVVSEVDMLDLIEIGNAFFKKQIWQALLSGKYFYAADTDEQYSNIRSKYKDGVNALLELVQENCNYGDDLHYHMQYAALNMAYEIDRYAMRSQKTPPYTANSIIEAGKCMLRKDEEGVSLLLGQVYDDLLYDANMAYRYYVKASEYRNPDAKYRQGIYWQDFGKEYSKAIDFYAQCTALYPEYYQAWYRMGTAYRNPDETALAAYRKVDEILTTRLEAGMLSGMDLEYLFKALHQCFCVCNVYLNNPRAAAQEDLRAEKVWESISGSQFFSLFGMDTFRERAQEHLSVQVIWDEIYTVAKKIGDETLEKIYGDKIANA